jgi:hypothetical protein
MDLQKLIQSANSKVQSLVQSFNQPQVNHNPINSIGQSRPNIPQAQPINLGNLTQQASNFKIPIIPGISTTPKKTYDQASSFWQEPAKIGAGIAISARNATTGEKNSFYQPDNPFAKALMGNQPVKSLEGQGYDISQALQKIKIAGHGLNPQIANTVGVPAVVGLGLLNTLPGGSERAKAVEEVAKTAGSFEKFAKIIKSNKGLIKTSEEIIADTGNKYKNLKDIFEGVNFGSALSNAKKEIPAVPAGEDALAKAVGENFATHKSGNLASLDPSINPEITVPENTTFKITNVLDNLRKQGEGIVNAIQQNPENGFARLDLGLTGGKTEGLASKELKVNLKKMLN